MGQKSRTIIDSLPAFKQRHARDQPLSTVRSTESTDSGPRPRAAPEGRDASQTRLCAHISRSAGPGGGSQTAASPRIVRLQQCPFGLLSCWLATVRGHWTSGLRRSGARQRNLQPMCAMADAACRAAHPTVHLRDPARQHAASPHPSVRRLRRQRASRPTEQPPSAPSPTQSTIRSAIGSVCASSAFPRPGRGRRARDMPRSRSPSSASWWKQALTQKTPAPSLAYSVQRRRPSSSTS